MLVQEKSATAGIRFLNFLISGNSSLKLILFFLKSLCEKMVLK